MVKTPGNRWLILTQYYPPEIGAPQIRLRSVARELKRHGIEVEVLTAIPNYPAGKIFPGYSGRWKIKETIDGLPITRTWVYAGTGKSKLIRLANYLSFTLTALLAALTGPRPDVMFVESQPLSLGLVAVLMKWLRKVPYVYNVPDLQVDVARQMGFMKNRGILRLAWQLENLFLREAWKISTVTHQFIEHFENVDSPARKPLSCPMEQILIFLSLGGRAKSCWTVGAYMGRKSFFMWEPMPIITGWKPSSKRLICFENTLTSYLSWSVTGRRELG